jgi:hypothetical protein
MSNGAQTVSVPHLGTSTIGYKFGKPYDSSIPTLVMVNSFSTWAELYRPQLADAKTQRSRQPNRHRAVRAR